MKKNNNSLIFFHDKNLVKQLKGKLKISYFDFIIVALLGFIHMFFGTSLQGLLFWTILEICLFFVIRSDYNRLLALVEFFQDDYIKNHPELPKDSSMLER